MSAPFETTWLTTPIVLGGGPAFPRMSRDEFFAFCQANREYRFERTTEGDLVIMTPTGGETGRRSIRLAAQLLNWSDRDGTGIAFDSSTGFWLPNGAERSPDVSWVRRDRWDALSPDERKKFPPLAPDFVIELRSETDRLAHLQAKMQEYADNGVRLGWLIDPSRRSVEIYRPGRAVEVLDGPASVAGDPELPGFVLDLAPVW
jgi:Uma2 family endonuclease